MRELTSKTETVMNSQVRQMLAPYTEDPSGPTGCIYAVLTRLIELAGRLEQTWIAVYGSVVHGEFAFDSSRGQPLSDIDLLVLSDSMHSLKLAASALASIDVALCQSLAPWFRLGVKFRTLPELRLSSITATELAAIQTGLWVTERPSLSSPQPTWRWWQQQADLAIRTRIFYDLKRIESLAAPSPSITRYLAARTILELPTAYLLTQGLVLGAYTDRVAAFLNNRHLRKKLPGPELANLDRWVTEALKIKKNEPSDFPLSFHESQALLVRNARILNILRGSQELHSCTGFLQENRPLDARDILLWQAAGARTTI